MGGVDRASQAQGVNSNDCYVRRPAGIQVPQRKAARETPRHSTLPLSDLAYVAFPGEDGDQRGCSFVWVSPSVVADDTNEPDLLAIPMLWPVLLAEMSVSPAISEAGQNARQAHIT